MATMLAIGSDPTWLREIAQAAEAVGHHVETSPSVCEAWQRDFAGASAPSVVFVDANCCDDRTGPALRALRARVRVPFVVVFQPASEQVARRLPSDALVARANAAEAVRRYVLDR